MPGAPATDGSVAEVPENQQQVVDVDVDVSVLVEIAIAIARAAEVPKHTTEARPI